MAILKSTSPKRILLLALISSCCMLQSCMPIPTEADLKPNNNMRLVTFFAWADQKDLNRIDWSHFTDAVYEYVDVSPEDGTLVYSWPDTALSDFVNKTKSHDVHPWIAVVGKWPNSTFFPTIESSSRQLFIKNLIEFCKLFGLYGVNLDIEPVSDTSTFSDFIVELATSLENSNLKLSIAVEPKNLYVLPYAAAYLDWIDVMAYDIYYTVGYPEHSTYEDSIQAIDLYFQGGIPKNKLLLGIPFYGRDAATGFFRYDYIANKYAPSPGANSVAEPSVPGGIIWFNGSDLVRQKTKYVIEHGYLGVAVYKAPLNIENGKSLLNSITEQFLTGTTRQGS
ncbi:MAG: glycoside hydrolase family 18 protein [Dehalogenimonas sp.]